MTDKKPAETALARQGTVEIVSPSQFGDYIAQQQQLRAHVLSPVTQIGNLPALWKVVPSLVYINASPAAGEVYHDRLFCKDNEVALTKVGLRRIAQGAGISTSVRRLDSATVPYYWNIEASISWRGFDGQIKSYTASVEWDLRDGGEQVNRMVKAAERNRKTDDRRPGRDLAEKQIDAARLNGYRNAEARAINAAIREFGLRQKYTQEDLKKPFVVFNMVVNPDMEDPEQRRMVLQSALGAAATLFQGDAPRALTSGHDPFADAKPPVNHDVWKVIDGETADEDEDFVPETKEAEDPPVKIVKVARRRPDNTPYLVTSASTEQVYIEQPDAAQAAFDAKEKQADVRLTTEMRGNERWLLEFKVAEKL